MIGKVNFLFIVSLFSLSCSWNHLPDQPDKIDLIYYNSPAKMNSDELKAGILWLSSYLGAELPLNEAGIKFKAENLIELDISSMGFNNNARFHLRKIISLLKQSGEYKLKNSVDIGRFFALCFNSSWHYYKITGAPDTYENFLKLHPGFPKTEFACDSSAIAPEGRLFGLPDFSTDAPNLVFVAQEGEGYFYNQTFHSSGIREVMDIMPNGQPRFMIYDSNGKLTSSTAAGGPGKPARCQWCHESKVQPLYKQTPIIQGYLNPDSFKLMLDNWAVLLKNFQLSKPGSLNYSETKAHQYGEFIYLSFYEPDELRLSLEWSMDIEEVRKLTSGIQLHTNPEFPFLSRVYHRYQIESLSPYQTLLTSEFSREISSYEPDYLQ